MYILDLGLDHQCANLPARPVPWERFESTLKELGVSSRQTSEGGLVRPTQIQIPETVDGTRSP